MFEEYTTHAKNISEKEFEDFIPVIGTCIQRKKQEREREKEEINNQSTTRVSITNQIFSLLRCR